MALIHKTALRRLATLHAVSLWKNGAFGPLRIQKTLFFADQESNEPYFFGFKKWRLGQFSDEVAASLNDLVKAGIVAVNFQGPADIFTTNVAEGTLAAVATAMRDSFPHWHAAISQTIREWGYLPNDQLLLRAHEHPTYTENEDGQVIFVSTLPDEVELTLDDDTAEELTYLVDPEFQRLLRRQLEAALAGRQRSKRSA